MAPASICAANVRAFGPSLPNTPSTFHTLSLNLLYVLLVVISRRYSFRAPTLASIAMLLSLRITRISDLPIPALFRPSNACPAVIAPSPITATTCLFSPLALAATAIPRAADMEVEECPVPNESYSLSAIFGKPLIPLYFLFVVKFSRRPVSILCP